MDAQVWNTRFAAAMLKFFAITPEDAGMSADDLARYREGNEEDPSQAALAFGEDYDLTLVGPWV